jgi:hypothetical protein
MVLSHDWHLSSPAFHPTTPGDGKFFGGGMNGIVALVSLISLVLALSMLYAWRRFDDSPRLVAVVVPHDDDPQ